MVPPVLLARLIPAFVLVMFPEKVTVPPVRPVTSTALEALEMVPAYVILLEPKSTSKATLPLLVMEPPLMVRGPLTLFRLTPLTLLLVDVIEAKVAPDPKEVLVISSASRAVIALAVPPILMVPPALAINPIPALGMLRLLKVTEPEPLLVMLMAVPLEY